MAPEVLLSKEYNESCDIWSAGVILHLLLVGVPPFYSRLREETVKQIASGAIDYSSKIAGSQFVEPCWAKISKEAKSFVMKMLQYEPEKRISAEEALNDPWIKKYSDSFAGKEEILCRSISNLKAFRTQMTFQKAVLAYVASQGLEKEEEKGIKEIFELFDVDKNGTISKEELLRGYSFVHKNDPSTQDVVNRIIRRLDINQNGSIDYNGTSIKT